MSIVEFRLRTAEALNRVAFKGERIVLERHGKPVAALVSVEDLAALEAHEDRIDLAAAKRAMKEPGSTPWVEVKAELAGGRLEKRGSLPRKAKKR